MQLEFAGSVTPATLMAPPTMVGPPVMQVVDNDPIIGRSRPGGRTLAVTDTPDNGKLLGFESVMIRPDVAPAAIVVAANAAVTTGAEGTVYSK